VTIFQFNQLSEDGQADILYRMGVFISMRSTEEHKVLLYQVEGFYVEIYYHPRSNTITEFRSFASTEQLEEYLEKISIADLFESNV
jgi:hypothetical protein